MPTTTRNLALAALGAGALIPAAVGSAQAAPIVAQVQELDPVVEMTQHAHAEAARRHVRLERTNARLKGERPERSRHELRDWSLEHLRDANRELRRENRTLRRRAARAATAPSPAAGAPVGSAGGAPGNLEAIAACESGGDASAVDASGTYRGKYQFDMQTWQSVGGTGDPAAAPEAEQDARAAQLYAQRGSSAWPVCG